MPELFALCALVAVEQGICGRAGVGQRTQGIGRKHRGATGGPNTDLEEIPETSTTVAQSTDGESSQRRVGYQHRAGRRRDVLLSDFSCARDVKRRYLSVTDFFNFNLRLVRFILHFYSPVPPLLSVTVFSSREADDLCAETWARYLAKCSRQKMRVMDA